MREQARLLARRNYRLTKRRLLRRYERNDRRGGAPVVVFSMSKTASTAIYDAVRDAVPGPVYKAHLLTRDGLTRAEDHYRRTDRRARPRHLFHALHLVRHLPTPDAPWTVVTLVREPVARAASDFFQSAERTRRTIEQFERFARAESIPRALTWFEREFAPAIGVDVYDYEFDRVAGFTTIEVPQARILVLRQESFDAAPGALSRLLGVAYDVPVANANVSAAKSYGDDYTTLLRDLRVPAAVLDLAYDSRYMRHFYAEEDIARYRSQWGG